MHGRRNFCEHPPRQNALLEDDQYLHISQQKLLKFKAKTDTPRTTEKSCSYNYCRYTTNTCRSAWSVTNYQLISLQHLIVTSCLVHRCYL